MLNRFVRKLGNRPDDFAAICFVVLGIVGVGVTLWKFQPGLSRVQETFDVLVVIGTTVLLAGLIQFLTHLIRRLTEYGVRREFHAFFGTEDLAIGIVPNLVTKHDLEGWRPEHATEAHPKGITNVVPFEDLKAAIKLAQLFDRFGMRFRLRLDESRSDKQLPKDTCVAIGLGFNHLTHKLALHSKLFEIRFEDQITGEAKDDFLLLNKHYPGTEHRNCALVVRVPHKHRGRKVPAFLCAGRLAAGTEAAGIFLRDHWRLLYEEYRVRRHSLDEYALGAVIEYDELSVNEARPIAIEFKRLDHSAH